LAEAASAPMAEPGALGAEPAHEPEALDAPGAEPAHGPEEEPGAPGA